MSTYKYINTNFVCIRTFIRTVVLYNSVRWPPYETGHALSRSMQWYGLQDPRFLLNFYLSGLVSVECTEFLYYGNPDIQNSAEIGDLAYALFCSLASNFRGIKIALCILYSTVLPAHANDARQKQRK